MKIAPLARELARHPKAFTNRIVHTGQHYDGQMSQVFFDELGIPRPDVNLGVGSASHAQQTAAVMAAFEPVMQQETPDLLIVVGDVNSTLACSLVAAKLGVPIAHVEAGLRSYDRNMPEEINRVLTDQISTLLFTTEPAARENLLREGVPGERIHFVGNVMIDTLLSQRARARDLGVPQRLGLEPRGFVLITLHRPNNVDDPATFERLMSALEPIGRDVPLVFPVHPRTRPAVVKSEAARSMVESNRLRLMDPLGYLEFVGLMDSSRAVVTDSGGIQEETTLLGVPCLTVRNNTERPVTVTHGTNHVVGSDPTRILRAWHEIRRETTGESRVPALWDGHAAVRIVEVLLAFASRNRGAESARAAVPGR
jgi:UDP-N-acetylglucosamine 2-epimerase (non-hydrolysing)